MTFEGLADSELVAAFYAGGTGGNGSGPGSNYGVAFGGPVNAFIDADSGGTGNFGGEPSPSTTIGFQPFSYMNVAAGFFNSLSFYYSNPNGDTSISVYAGLNGTGSVLATLFLPRTAFQGQMDPTGNLSPLVFASVAFAGTARSVDFSPLSFSAYVDDVSIETSPQVVPEPASLGLMLIGLAGLRVRRARK